MTRIALVFLAAIAVSSFSENTAALRGPPLICHEIEIGSAASIPWKSVGYGMGPDHHELRAAVAVHPRNGVGAVM